MRQRFQDGQAVVKQASHMYRIGVDGDLRVVLLWPDEAGNHPPAVDPFLRKMCAESLGITPAVLAKDDVCPIDQFGMGSEVACRVLAIVGLGAHEDMVILGASDLIKGHVGIEGRWSGAKGAKETVTQQAFLPQEQDRIRSGQDIDLDPGLDQTTPEPQADGPTAVYEDVHRSLPTATIREHRTVTSHFPQASGRPDPDSVSSISAFMLLTARTQPVAQGARRYTG
jgi:hypothetical protein